MNDQETSLQTSPKTTKTSPKRPRVSGRLPQITPADCARVAEFEAEGLALSKALRQVNGRFTLHHWQESLARDPGLLQHYETKVGELQLAMLRTIAGTTRANLPVGNCWILERRFPGEFAQPKAGGGQSSVVNNFNAPVQINVREAAKALLRKVTVPPKQIAEAKQGNAT